MKNWKPEIEDLKKIGFELYEDSETWFYGLDALDGIVIEYYPSGKVFNLVIAAEYDYLINFSSIAEIKKFISHFKKQL